MVQGDSISPLLANICLHYAFDPWVKQWRGRNARGDVLIVRFADGSRDPASTLNRKERGAVLQVRHGEAE